MVQQLQNCYLGLHFLHRIRIFVMLRCDFVHLAQHSHVTLLCKQLGPQMTPLSIACIYYLRFDPERVLPTFLRQYDLSSLPNVAARLPA